MVSEPNASAEGEGRPQPNYRGGDSTPRRVFEAVLQQTADLGSPDQGLAFADLAVLAKVARRLRGVEFQLDPVVIELVRAALAGQLKNTGQTKEQFTAIAERVARTFYDNPETHERLRLLWVRLSAME